ncbi:sensor histidine kinase [Paenibacillaceae bacterium WGS1546]|uniref:sensor histidine kinase n=1 Tax=Cohnella sp. WGS1546 TaxID=3366810 RepID=UPI00372D0DAE
MNSIKARMAIRFSILFLVCLCLAGWYLFQKTKSTLQDTTIEFMQLTSRQVSQSMDESLGMAEKSVNTIISNWSLQSILNEQSPALYYRQREQIKSVIRDASSASEYLSAVQIYSPQYGYLGFNNSPLQPYEMKNLLFDMTSGGEAPFERIMWLVSEEKLREQPYIYGIRRMTNFIGQEPLGYALVLLNADFLLDAYSRSDMALQGELLLYDNSGNVIAGSEKLDDEAADYYFQRTHRLEAGDYLVDDSPYGESLIVHNRLNNGEWHTVVVIPVSALTEKIGYIQSAWLWVSVAAVLIIIASSWLLSLRITLPIRRMQRAMEQVEQVKRGDLPPLLRETKVKEIDELSRSFNRMSKEIHTLFHQVYAAEIRRQKSELRELQAQINPHFLFNTLDSVYWLLIMKEQEEAAGIVVALSRLFRYSTGTRQDIVTLREELEHIKNYMYVQQVRFDKIAVDFRIAEGTESRPVLKLMIQPLVENAIYHGLEKRHDGGKVTISAELAEGNAVLLTVRDNGAGIPPNRLDEIRAALQSQPALSVQSEDGLALENIYQRMRLYYGGKGSMQIDSVQGEGTKVTLRLPYPVRVEGETGN